MKKVLYIYPIKTSFVKSDLNILSKHYTIQCFSFAVKKKIYTPFAFLKQLSFLLFHLPGAAFVVSQFSGYHSFLPALLCKIFNLKHYIILHGTECNNFPEYSYGYKIRPLLFWFSWKSLALSSQILPVSEALIEQEYEYFETAYQKQGVRSFYPNLATPIFTIHNGVSPDRFNILENVARLEKSFVTVATGLDDRNRRIIKGLDMVCALADKLPDSVFTFVGGTIESGFDLPKNVKVLPPIPNKELQDIYNQHQFYIQLSVSEGFGISVVEAMMCGCIPIVSAVGILPEIVGSYGYVLKKKSSDQLRSLVFHACESAHTISLEEMRKSVISRFSLEKRELALIDCFDQET